MLTHMICCLLTQAIACTATINAVAKSNSEHGSTKL